MKKPTRKSSRTAAPAPVISVVAPCHNEQDNIAALVTRLTAVLGGIGEPYEIVLVDDGSRDQTWQAIDRAAQSEPAIVGLRLSKNFSHQSALLAGLSRAKGEAIISMDSDLQHPPETIPELVAAWREGHEIVNTRRVDGKVASPFKRVTSKLFYRFFSFMTGIDMEEGASDFRLLDRRALDELLTFAGNDRFIRGSVQWLGFSLKTVPYQLAERLSGQTSYSLKNMLRFAAVAITSFSTKPLRYGIWLGIAVGVLALLELFYVVVQAITGNVVPGWASTVGITSFLFAVMFMVMGIIGTYVARIYTLLQNRPPFIIAENTESDGTEAMVHTDVKSPSGKSPATR